MRTPHPPDPALLVASVLGRSEAGLGAGVDALRGLLGPLAFVSDLHLLPPDAPGAEELGGSPLRRIVAAERLLVDPAELPGVRRACGRLEISLGRTGPAGRQVSIDPGLLTGEHLVMARTRPAPHRIYLGRGVYGDLTLLHGPAGFEPLPWTPGDFASAELREIFGRLRALFVQRRDEFVQRRDEGVAP